MKINFYDYGPLEYIEPEEYYAGEYGLFAVNVASVDGGPGDTYDILLEVSTQKFYCSNI